jgi:lipocalin
MWMVAFVGNFVAVNFNIFQHTEYVAVAATCKPHSRKLDIHNRKMLTNDEATALD